MSDADPPPTVELLAVDEDVLDRLLRAAVADAAADEVTAPVTPGGGWTPERVDWMRALHRQARAGLDGPAGQATWAVLADGDVVGAVRLKRADEPGVLETGIWLTRGARGRQVGRQAVAGVLERAAMTGAHAVLAVTTADNLAALALLRRLGFECGPPDPCGRVPARRPMRRRPAPHVGTPAP